MFKGGFSLTFKCNCCKIRFINLVESLDQNDSWETVKTVRGDYLDKYNGASCTYLLPTKDIEKNNVLFMDLLNSSSSFLQKNLTREVIENGAKMFLHLNSCPPNKKIKKNIEKYFERVLKKKFFEPTNIGMILYIMNAMKVFPNDKRIIASKILDTVSTLYKMPYFRSKKGFKILTDDSTIGKTKILGIVYF